MSRKPNWHPIKTLPAWKGVQLSHALNWLQLNGHISDNCTTIYDIASCDVEKILHAAGKRHFFPADIAPCCKPPELPPTIDL
jgi:hypothetical protein